MLITQIRVLWIFAVSHVSCKKTNQLFVFAEITLKIWHKPLYHPIWLVCASCCTYIMYWHENVQTKKKSIWNRYLYTISLGADKHRHQRKFSSTCVCRVTFKHLPQTLSSHIRSFGTLGQLLKFSKKTLKNLKTPPRGPGGVSKFCWGLISPFLWE